MAKVATKQRKRTTTPARAARIVKPPKSLSSDWLEITPEIAREWLKRNISNRPIKRPHWLRMARDMKGDKWDKNGETITFDAQGNLVDGQHRLLACAHAGVAFVSLVVGGVSEKSRITIDTGVTRRSSDMLSLQGERHSGSLGSILSNIARWEAGVLMKGRHSPATRYELLDTLKKYPEARRSAAMADQNAFGKLGRRGLLGFFHFRFSMNDDMMADSFYDALMTGELIRTTDPVYKLRERLLRNRHAVRKLTELETIGLIVKTWNAERNGTKMKILSFKSDREPVPEIV